jgi:predicted transcriptional regulator
MSAKKDAALSLDVESSLKRKLSLIAKQKDLSLSQVIREALRQYLDSKEAA